VVSARLVVRVAFRNLRHRPLSALLLLVALTAATTTLTLAFAVGAAARAPWDRTFDQTRGADVIANSESVADLTALAHAPGVVSSLGPAPYVPVTAQLRGYAVPLAVVGRSSLNSSIDAPHLTAGAADLSGRSIVLERSVAEAVGARIGDSLTIAGRLLIVRGIAISVSQPPFPRSAPGLAWVSPTTAAVIAPAGRAPVQQVELRLANHAGAAAFATTHQSPRIYITSWEDTRSAALQDIATIRVILLTVSGLLALLTAASVTVLVATNMDARLHQIGTLKAVGVTPRQITAISLTEQLTVAALATVIGAFGGTALAGVIGQPPGDLLTAPNTPVFSWTRILSVGAVAIAAVLLPAIRPAWRAARSTTILSLTAQTRAPRHTARFARLASAMHLPLAVILGARAIGRRPMRTLLAVGSFTLSVAMVTAAAASQRTLTLQLREQNKTAAQQGLASSGLTNLADQAAADRIRAIVYLFAIVFVVLAAVNLSIVATAAARDAAPNHAILRAIGFTPTQTATSLLTTQTIGGALAAIAGLPLGLLLFHAVYAATNNSNTGPHNPPAIWLTIIAAAAIALGATLAASSARTIALRPIALTLTAD
jgi:ABC-type antimicrobial peptide transport system permease subunit